MRFTVIFTEDALYLSKRRFADWSEVQRSFASYKASLSDFDARGLVEFLEHEYGRGPSEDDESWREIVEGLAASPSIETVRIG